MKTVHSERRKEDEEVEEERVTKLVFSPKLVLT
jgi:hypothetical protein